VSSIGIKICVENPLKETNSERKTITILSI